MGHRWVFVTPVAALVRLGPARQKLRPNLRPFEATEAMAPLPAGAPTRDLGEASACALAKACQEGLREGPGHR